MHQQAGFILKPIINKLLNTACFKYAFGGGGEPNDNPSISQPLCLLTARTYQTHPGPLPAGTQFCAQRPGASGIMAETVLLLMTSKGSFFFRKQKFTAKHTASIHKIIYGTDN